ncbi:MAG: aspartate 1-decarboxylase [Muribaculaceae bacterium]|nr:aspartate 1-decarboxylase [Muribaculaceae bacterium]
MQIQVVKSKIHRVTVTGANLNYIGSITIDEDLMDAANIIEGERVYVVDNNNGERLDTYVIKGERGKGEICLNGAAARKVEPGDVVIIMSYAFMTPDEARKFKPAIVFPDTHTNKIIE